ncbi:rod-determining factor RdfA [Haloarcula laminariae]|uniref:rod-determining factor RdfA n=1 Tax=Haloarcula laminariae TaxID=2961577 RepID=UPI002404A54F|nr:rod-determining factor RdfA [Halomicroarcula sp. FL173]
MSDGDRVSGACSCKVGRTAGKYGLDGLDERLRERRADGASLRRLETVVNEAVLQAALEGADTDVLRDAASIYRNLTGEDVSTGVRTETEAWLSRVGVDPAELDRDFVSYQTVRSHFRECLGVDTARERSLSVDDAEGTIEWARSRSQGIVGRTIERLDGTDGFHCGSVDVTTVVRVSCADCGGSYPVERFLDRGGCDCETDAQTQ